jgi:hypothetical protein
MKLHRILRWQENNHLAWLIWKLKTTQTQCYVTAVLFYIFHLNTRKKFKFGYSDVFVAETVNETVENKTHKASKLVISKLHKRLTAAPLAFEFAGIKLFMMTTHIGSKHKGQWRVTGRLIQGCVVIWTRKRKSLVNKKLQQELKCRRHSPFNHCQQN